MTPQQLLEQIERRCRLAIGRFKSVRLDGKTINGQITRCVPAARLDVDGNMVIVYDVTLAVGAARFLRKFQVRESPA